MAGSDCPSADHVNYSGPELGRRPGELPATCGRRCGRFEKHPELWPPAGYILDLVGRSIPSESSRRIWIFASFWICYEHLPRRAPSQPWRQGRSLLEAGCFERRLCRHQTDCSLLLRSYGYLRKLDYYPLRSLQLRISNRLYPFVTMPTVVRTLQVVHIE